MYDFKTCSECNQVIGQVEIFHVIKGSVYEKCQQADFYYVAVGSDPPHLRLIPNLSSNSATTHECECDHPHECEECREPVACQDCKINAMRIERFSIASQILWRIPAIHLVRHKFKTRAS